MTDEPQDNETSEPQENPAQDEGSEAAGQGSPAQPPETPDPAPPAADASEQDGGDAVPEQKPAEAPAAEQEEEPLPEEKPTEAPAAEQEKPEPAPVPQEKKKDAIPGADLEPIAVEPKERPLSAEEQARREAEKEERAQREAALTGDSVEGGQEASRAPAKMEGDSRYLATGKRKQSIARVILLPGGSKFEVNKRPLEEFFPRPLHQTIARQSLAVTGYEGSVDVRVRVDGGGVSGQAGAVRHGIARALIEVDPELRGELKRHGFLTRDARVKERRKAGLKKARKRPQFSKR